MTVVRLRPEHSAEALAEMYARPHDTARFGRGTQMRVVETIVFARSVWPDLHEWSIADLACGDARIARALSVDPILGDLAPGYAFTGPIEETLFGLGAMCIATGKVDLFVLSETLEHLDDPGDVLRRIGGRARRLLLTTPLEAWHDLTENPEHYWAWDQEYVEQLLDEAGWKIEAFATLDTRLFGEQYLYGLWALS